MPEVDPRTPVIAGVGQASQRPPDAAKPPIELFADAARAADADTGAPGALLARADTVAAVRSCRGRTPTRARCSRASSASRRATPSVTTVGGNSPQLLVNEIAARIARGDADVVLVGGAEIDAHALAARAASRASISTGTRATTRRAPT